MTKPIYIYVADKGFVRDFDLAGPVLMFAQYPTLAQDFETVQQANHVIRVNGLDPISCFLLQQV
jgi:hypothetical protein